MQLARTPHCVLSLQRGPPSQASGCCKDSHTPCAGGPEPPGAAAGEDEGLGHREPRSLRQQ